MELSIILADRRIYPFDVYVPQAGRPDAEKDVAVDLNGRVGEKANGNQRLGGSGIRNEDG